MSSLASRLGHLGLHRPRLLAASAFGIAAFFILPADWTVISRVLVAWNIGVWPYLATLVWLMLRTSPEGVRAIAKQEDASSASLMMMMSAAAVLSLAAIVLELAHGRDAGEAAIFVYAITALTVAGSWLLLAFLFTFHYAHLYYSAAVDSLPLVFPDGLKSLSYVDFMYFAFTIAVATQTADVTVHTTTMRATVLWQSVLSFFFNLAILGLLVNMAAGLAGGK
ncbi:MAG: DUF1345 domain-containing protein [Ramlibacter sp.]|nr:DUF1345 domain-containing protein [Ramlibacter sp.]